MPRVGSLPRPRIGMYVCVHRYVPPSAGGAGYSDALVLPDGSGGEVLAMAFQKTFDPPVPSIEGGGYDMGLALLPLDCLTD